MEEATKKGGVTQLKPLVERIERLEEEKKTLSEDTKQVYLEAKSLGFDVKIIRKLVAMRKKRKEELDEEEALLRIYMEAVQ